MSFGEWKTESGMKDDFVMTIDKAHFGYNEAYNADALLLKLEGQDEEDGEEVCVELSTGKGWEKKDERGKEAECPENPRKRFHNRSLYGQLIDLAVMPKEKTHPVSGLNGLDMTSVLEEMDADPKVAETWKGMRFRFKVVTFDYGTRTEENEYGEEVEKRMTSERVFPVEFLGKASKPKKETKKKETKKKKPAELGVLMTQVLEATDEDVIKKVQKAFKKAKGDFEKFEEAMMEIEDIAADDDLIALVVDQDELFAELLDS